MLRLIKLALYALVGYAIYEIYQGMTRDDSASSGSGGRRGSRDLRRALSSDEGRMGALTGAGAGLREQTLDLHGTSIPHQVGRGVISA